MLYASWNGACISEIHPFKISTYTVLVSGVLIHPPLWHLEPLHLEPLPLAKFIYIFYCEFVSTQQT